MNTVTVHLGQRLEVVELLYIYRTLVSLDWNRTQAAKVLGVSVRTVYTKIRAMETNLYFKEIAAQNGIEYVDRIG